MKKLTLVVGLCFLTNCVNAQIKSKSSFIENSHPKTIIDSVFAYKPRPYFLGNYTKKKSNFSICSHAIPNPKTIFYHCEMLKEIDLNALNYKSKLLFFKMKMWQYFR